MYYWPFGTDQNKERERHFAIDTLEYLRGSLQRKNLTDTQRERILLLKKCLTYYYGLKE